MYTYIVYGTNAWTDTYKIQDCDKLTIIYSQIYDDISSNKYKVKHFYTGRTTLSHSSVILLQASVEFSEKKIFPCLKTEKGKQRKK